MVSRSILWNLVHNKISLSSSFAKIAVGSSMRRMDTFLDIAEKVLLAILNFAYFVILSLLFLPAFFIVTYMQKTWEEKMKDVLGL